MICLTFLFRHALTHRRNTFVFTRHAQWSAQPID